VINMYLCKGVSDGFKVANLIATILIISIHYNSKMFIRQDEVLSWFYLVQEFISNGVARVAVPFFAYSSGLFFFLGSSGFEVYIKKCKKRIHTLLVPYLLGSMLIFISDMTINFLIGKGPLDFGFDQIVFKTILNPYPVQFWFLRDLIVITIVSPIIYYLSSTLKIIYFPGLFACWMFDIQIFPLIFDLRLISIETLLFFSLGCYSSINIHSLNKIFEIREKYLIYSVIVFPILLFLLRVLISPVYRHINIDYYSLVAIFCQKTAIFFGIYSLILGSIHIASNKLIYISGFTFFVYMFHGVPLNRFIIKFCNYITTDKYFFYISFPIATIISFLLSIALYRYHGKIYNILTGARGPTKVIDGDLGLKRA